MVARFQDYAEGLKPLLDTAFTSHLLRLLGDVKPLPSAKGMKVLAGGKRIRGSLLCLVTEALGGTVEGALPRTIALELIQTATLIHDDFVDQHRVRRNLPALWTLEGPRRAVLLGDIIFASAIQMMSALGSTDGRIVSQAIAEVSQGAYQEPLHPAWLREEIEANRASELYEKIIYLKTGVLFGAACQLGAVAAGGGEELQHRWRRYGLSIGEAYQIADDLHEIERCLLARSITGGEMTSLVPVLLAFVSESRPYVLEVFRKKSFSLRGTLLKHFMTAAEVAKAEIEKRLRSAVSGIEKNVPDNEYGSLARTAPWDIIRMFNEAMLTVSSP